MTNFGELAHIELNVLDLAAARRFWQPLLERLHYTVFQEWDAGFSMRLKGTYLVFVQTEPAFEAAGFHRKRPGLNHLAFYVETPAQVDEFATYLRDIGAKELYAEAYPYAAGPNVYTAFFEDPQRLKIEIVTEIKA